MSERAKRIRRVIHVAWITIGLGATAVFVLWSLVAYRANPEARRAARSDSLVAVTRADGVWRFERVQAAPSRTSLVFFPGALVDPRAYAPLARAVALAGHPVLLVELPRRAAFGGADSPELDARIESALTAMRDRRVVIAGHSRGAVVVSRLAAGRSARLAGAVIIGSTHPRDVDLSALTIPITKVVGTRDGIAPPGKVRENQRLLPHHTRWVWIEGGNHSQFGWYGFQPLDRRPRIAASAQRGMTIQAVLELLGRVDAQ